MVPLALSKEMTITPALEGKAHILPAQITYLKTIHISMPFTIDALSPLVHFGETVTEGQPIFQVTSHSFQQTLIQALQAYALAQEQLQQQSNYMQLNHALVKLGTVSKQQSSECLTKYHSTIQEFYVKESELITQLKYLNLKISDTNDWPLDPRQLLSALEKYPILITSPVTGILSPPKQKPETYTSGEVFARVLPSDSIVIEALADEQVIMTLVVDNPIEIIVDKSHQRLSGRITQIHNIPFTYQPTPTFKVEIQPDGLIENPSAVSAHVSIQTSKHASIYIPLQYVQKVDQQYFVLIKTNQKTALKPVELGSTNKSQVEVTEGLSKGDVIVQPN
ncbi:hypothetical protein OAT84_01445 [Gammaproteobacteria bacterium]|nr:hypothetical protein [Gammaproteobacteria bacterium]